VIRIIAKLEKKDCVIPTPFWFVFRLIVDKVSCCIEATTGVWKYEYKYTVAVRR